ncbi:hypothetical protein [Acidipropionibacterium virtanenii]|uniref:Uncharacterized protein n=1 Tax=Acidipropionibacterium virtanenii TaxID=2057246 RepID=A0A344UTH8_9ACTN|nr:hypothetical protein [Acidipropionibacterium virtanenii]AXE38576.1 hypothetical protein JS278_01405 [Acidipropionibacterium virtanenii]
MGLLWLWVLIAALVGGLALTAWGLWWLWHKVEGLGEQFEGLAGRLDDLAGILDGLEPQGLGDPSRGPSDKA